MSVGVTVIFLVFFYLPVNFIILPVRMTGIISYSIYLPVIFFPNDGYNFIFNLSARHFLSE